MRLLNKIAKALQGSSKGVTLIEVLIALAILGIIAVAFLSGLSTSLKAVFISDERSVAQSLATSQMEYVKSQDYCDDDWSYTVTSSAYNYSTEPCWLDDPPFLSDDYAGYCVKVKAEKFDADGDGSIEVPGEDADIRKITVTVYHDENCVENEVLTLEDYKVNRD